MGVGGCVGVCVCVCVCVWVCWLCVCVSILRSGTQCSATASLLPYFLVARKTSSLYFKENFLLFLGKLTPFFFRKTFSLFFGGGRKEKLFLNQVYIPLVYDCQCLYSFFQNFKNAYITTLTLTLSWSVFSETAVRTCCCWFCTFVHREIPINGAVLPSAKLIKNLRIKKCKKIS